MAILISWKDIIMFFGVSHIVIQVTDLERSKGIWTTCMGFSPVKQEEDFVDIDTGNVCIRLMRVNQVESHSSVRICVADVNETYGLLMATGARSRYEPQRTQGLEEIACVSDLDGHTLVLWRALTEDEWGFVPEIPKQGEWYPDAEDLLKRLLSHVPALFRMLARRKTTRIIEMLAKEMRSPVTRDIVIRGYITASAKVTRFRLVGPLKSEGIDPEKYRAEFEYE